MRTIFISIDDTRHTEKQKKRKRETKRHREYVQSKRKSRSTLGPGNFLIKTEFIGNISIRCNDEKGHNFFFVLFRSIASICHLSIGNRSTGYVVRAQQAKLRRCRPSKSEILSSKTWRWRFSMPGRAAAMLGTSAHATIWIIIIIVIWCIYYFIRYYEIIMPESGSAVQLSTNYSDNAIKCMHVAFRHGKPIESDDAMEWMCISPGPSAKRI